MSNKSMNARLELLRFTFCDGHTLALLTGDKIYNASYLYNDIMGSSKEYVKKLFDNGYERKLITKKQYDKVISLIEQF